MQIMQCLLSYQFNAMKLLQEQDLYHCQLIYDTE